MKLITEWELHVHHEVEEHAECPHVNLKAVCLVSVYLWWHVILRSQYCASNLVTLFTKTEIGQFESLFYKENCTYFPLTDLTRMFWDLISLCR